MEIPFEKYHGCGNDFILIQNLPETAVLTSDQISFLCDRHRGIGGDGLILLYPHATYAFSMRYYNADGLESTMCGNGGRCAALFAALHGNEANDFAFLAVDGSHHAIILKIQQDSAFIKLKMRDVDQIAVQENLTILNTGSPHAVLFAATVPTLDVKKEGSQIRNSPPYRKEGINVDFVENIESGLFVRTYERGVEDETLSCGTGVTASVLAAAANNGAMTSPVRVKTPGGDFQVYFSRKGSAFTDIWLEGPAVRVFAGTINL